MSSAAYIIVIGLAAVILVVRLRGRLKGMRAGDLFSVAIPRTLERPLATGTRLDIGAALKRAGVAPDEIRPLLDGSHDQELLDRYWALEGAAHGNGSDRP